MALRKVKRALLSVSDKRGVVDFAKRLSALGVEILSTGGTARTLKEASIPVRDVSEFTGFPEVMDGRVKTLHPKVHAGILAIRDNEEHRRQMKELEVEPIDLVVVNLYPFRETIARPGCTLEEAIENIDIGGPTMIRSAAKNNGYVAVVVDPDDYGKVADELEKNDSSLTDETRFELAKSAFRHTAAYDAAIIAYLDGLGEERFPKTLFLGCRKIQDLRYGENPHQRAAFFSDLSADAPGLGHFDRLGGKELSFNNILDLQAALNIVREFDGPAAVVIKHTNPCGAALGENLAEAFKKAYAGDPVSAFGSIVGLNRALDEATAEEISQPGRFIEAIIAPDFDAKALEILRGRPKWGKSVRLVQTGDFGGLLKGSLDVRSVLGGFLIQESDEATLDENAIKVVTDKSPSASQMEDLKFAWVICKHVKSNAIVLAKERAIVGVGAGQMSRLDSTIIAVRKSQGRSGGAVLASDAFFPFPDAVEEAARAGVQAVMQPGGAKNDAKVIEASNKLGLAMVFTGMRHFRH